MSKKAIVANVTFDGKPGWKQLTKLLDIIDDMGVSEVKWDKCTFKNLNLDYKKLKTPTQKVLFKWLAEREQKENI